MVPAGEEGGQGVAELSGAGEVEFGEAVAVGGEEDLAEGGEFEEFAEHGRRPGARVAEGQAGVGVDVGEGLGEPAGLAVVGVAVQQDQGDAGRLDGADERGEEGGVGAVQGEVGIAEAGVQLEREGEGRAGRRGRWR